MVLSLREKSIESDPIIAFWEKFTERFSEAMTTWTDQFVSNMKQARSKSEPEHDRRVLICGYTQEEDCGCVATKIVGSEYDLDEAAVELEGENGYQSKLQSQQDGDLFVEKAGDHEVVLAKLEYSNPSIHPICDPVTHNKVKSLLEIDLLSHGSADKAAKGMFYENQKERNIADKAFDKNPERNGNIVELKPKPPDEYDSLNDLTMRGFNSLAKTKPEEQVPKRVVAIESISENTFFNFSSQARDMDVQVFDKDTKDINQDVAAVHKAFDGGTCPLIHQLLGQILHDKIVVESSSISIWQMAATPYSNTCSDKKHHSAYNENEHGNGVSDDGCVQIYSISDPDQLIYNKLLPRFTGRTLSVTWSADTNKIYSGSSDGFIRCWDARTAREIYGITVGLGGLGNGLELCIGSLLVLRCDTFVSEDNCGSVQFWDSHHGTLLQALSCHKGGSTDDKS